MKNFNKVISLMFILFGSFLYSMEESQVVNFSALIGETIEDQYNYIIVHKPGKLVWEIEHLKFLGYMDEDGSLNKHFPHNKKLIFVFGNDLSKEELFILDEIVKKNIDKIEISKIAQKI